MDLNLTSSRSLRTAAPFYLAMLLLVLSLLIFFASGWAFYLLFRSAKEYELSKRLETIATAVEPSVSERAAFVLRALDNDDSLPDGTMPNGDAEWLSWFESLRAVYDDQFLRLQSQLENLRISLNLKEVALISPQKRLICSAPNTLRPGLLAPLVSMDTLAWESAIRGKTEDVPYYEYEGVPYSRVYMPVRLASNENLSDQPDAILRIEAGLETFNEISHLRTQGLVLASIVTILMGTVAFLFYRLIRQFAHIEQRAAHRDRLEAMGALVAGVAHEIRNPLGIMRALGEGLRDDLTPDSLEREMVTDILGEVNRMNDLVAQYLAFAQPDAAAAGEPADPPEVIRSITHLLEKGEAAKGTPVDLAIDESIPRVTMGERALRQVLLNLLMNARDAMASGNGTSPSPIRVSCRSRRNAAQVEIEVRDSGCGIAPRDMRRIFEPFFTTKTSGSGLGLSICRQLVEDCGGEIHVESETGKGTAVHIVLPAAS